MTRGRQRLLARLDRVEKDREELLGRLAQVEEKRLRESTSPEVWSVLQIVEHLVQAEDHVLLVKKAPDQLDRRPRSLRNRIVFQLVILILKAPFPVKVPGGDAMHPKGGAGLPELAERWRASQARLRGIVEGEGAASGIDPMCDAVFRHPVAGPMTPAQAVSMLSTHQRRHLAQIRDRLSD